VAKKKAMSKDQDCKAQPKKLINLNKINKYSFIFGFILFVAMHQALTIYPPFFCLANFDVLNGVKRRNA
jgi:hypothetical protein